MEKTDVIIIGAGATGLTVALECARHGIAFRIFDKRPSTERESRALLVWSAAQEVFAASGALDAMNERGLRLAGLRVCSPHRTLMDIPFAAEVQSRFPRPLVLPQRELERILNERLQELGHRVEGGMEFLDLEQDAAGVCVSLLPEHEEEPVKVQAKFLVGCDGMQSDVRHAVGARFVGRGASECFIFCEADVRGMETAPRVMHLFVSSAGPLTMFPVRDNIWRITSARSGGAGTARPTLEEMQEHVAIRTGVRGMALAGAENFLCSRIIERGLQNFRAGRVLLAGDAAHVHHLVTGQGLTMGVGDAFNLGWKLAALVHGERTDTEAVLESYGTERADISKRVIAGTERFIKMVFATRAILAGFRRSTAGLFSHGPSIPFTLANVLSGTGKQARYKCPSALLGNENLWHEDWRDYGCPVGSAAQDTALHRFDGSSTSLFAELHGDTSLVLFSGRKPRHHDITLLEKMCRDAEQRNMNVVAIWHGVEAPNDRWLLDCDGAAHRRYGVDFRAAYSIRPDNIIETRSQPCGVGA